EGVEDGDMRLADGESANEGRVEIFYRGQWGTVCDNLWDLTDAIVVCRALGFENATEALGRAAFGPGRPAAPRSPGAGTGCQGRDRRLRHAHTCSPLLLVETSSAHTLDLSYELPAALEQIFDSQRGCDLSIRVRVKDEEEGGLDMCGHRLILSTNPEAEALWREPGSTVTLEVDEECLPVVRDFIRYLYSRRLDVSPAAVKCFHKLASAYGAWRLQSFCSSLFAVLLPEDSSFQTPLDLYAYAQATRDPVLEALCLQFLAWNFEALTQAEAWPAVPAALLRALLSRSDLAVPSELALLTAVDAWSQETQPLPGELEGVLREVRFPMMLPETLFELQFNLSLYGAHEALFREQTLRALQFHTVPLRLLAQHGGLNLSDSAFQPRLYTSPTWSTNVSREARAAAPRYPYKAYWAEPSYRYNPTQSFQTPQHPSFLFRSRLVSWSAAHLPTVQSCWNYGFSCSPDEVPLLGLSRYDSSDPTIGYQNKALMLCEGRFVADVTDFLGQKALIPNALGTNGSRSASVFPCRPGAFSGFRVVIRPFYLTNASGLA
ncbi:LG3BP protein, partial [Crocuta crocuta]